MFFNFPLTKKKQVRISLKCPIDLHFFYLFLLTFSLEIRKVIWFFPIKNTFNEYAGIYIYLSDLFLFFTMLSWIVLILRNKNLYLSIKSSSLLVYWKKRNNFLNLSIFSIPLILFFWSLFSVFWSENKIISLYRTAKFFELYLLFLYIASRFFPYYWLHIKKKIITTDKQKPQFSLKEQEKQFVSRETKLENFEQERQLLLKMQLFFRALLFGFLFIGLFDHYLWDIWQGQILFWLTIGILFGSILCASNESSDDLLLKASNENLSYQLPVANKTIKNTLPPIITFLNLFISIGIVQALIGIIQFVRQSSLGLFWLKESLINEKIAGTAKIIINHHLLIRAYGLFPHPNIFAGFLFFLIIITILYKNLFHVKQIKISANSTMPIKTRGKAICCSNQLFFLIDLLKKIFKFVSRETNNENNYLFIPKSFFINTILAIEILALILSFSKSAIIALFLAILYITVSRETFHAKYKNITMVTTKQFKPLIISLILLGVSFCILQFLKVDFYTLFIKSLNERYLYFSISKQTILNNPFFGIGEGQFITNSVKIFPDLEIWQYQPVHNIFLLIWSEWGIVGLVLFVLFLWKLLHIKPTNKIKKTYKHKI